MADKHTKRELFQTLLVLASATESEKWVTDGLTHELDLLDKKRATPGTNSKKALEQKVEQDAIVAVLSDKPLTATEVALATGFSVQKVSANFRKMVPERVTRTEVKGKATFTLA